MLTASQRAWLRSEIAHRQALVAEEEAVKPAALRRAIAMRAASQAIDHAIRSEQIGIPVDRIAVR